jgi:hypothetical protein
MTDYYLVYKPEKYQINIFYRVIDVYFNCSYCDQYKNHYISYLLNFAIDYIVIDGDYIILPGDTNISLRISDFKFYPFFALLNTNNAHVINYVIDNYELCDSSVVLLISLFKDYSSDNYCDNNRKFFLIKLIKKYSDVLKSCDCSRYGYYIRRVDNISSFTICAK